MNYCISEERHEGNQTAALLRCNGRPGCFAAAFGSSALLGLPPENTPYIYRDLDHLGSKAIEG